MARITEFEHTSTTTITWLQWSQFRMSGLIQAITTSLFWFLGLPWMIWDTFSTTGKFTKCSKQTKEMVTVVSRQMSIDDSDSNYRDHHHGINYRDHYYGTDDIGLVSGIDMNMFSQMRSSSIDHVIRVILPQSLCRAMFTPSRKYERIMFDLIRLEDNGDFEAFDECSFAFLAANEGWDPDITTGVLIEQSRCMLYRDRVPLAKCLALKAIKLTSKTAWPGMFIARVSRDQRVLSTKK